MCAVTPASRGTRPGNSRKRALFWSFWSASLLYLIATGVAFLSFHTIKDSEEAKNERGSVQQVYSGLKAYNLMSIEEMSKAEAEQSKAEAKYAEAKRIWGGIPAGTVIAERGEAVGDNRVQQNLQKEGAALAASAYEMRRTIALRLGQGLLASRDKGVWLYCQTTQQRLRALRSSHSWLYRADGVTPTALATLLEKHWLFVQNSLIVAFIALLALTSHMKGVMNG